MKYLYVEEPLLEHPETEAIRKQTGATLISIKRYGEIFNRHGGHFRLQKKQSALILAQKKGKGASTAPQNSPFEALLKASERSAVPLLSASPSSNPEWSAHPSRMPSHLAQETTPLTPSSPQTLPI